VKLWGFKRLVMRKYIIHIFCCLASNFSKTKLPSNAIGTSDMIRPDQVIQERMSQKLDPIPKYSCNHI